MPTPQKTAKKVAKKAAKKVAKKAAKKTPGHPHDKHHQADDLRRAYEHMGRLEALRGSLGSSTVESIAALTRLAQRAIDAEQNRDAAELLRASEHLSFAALASGPGSGRGGRISTELQQSIAEQFEDLTRRADQHWSGGGKSASILVQLYKSARENASQAFDTGAYHQALEFARAAAALAHVSPDAPHRLTNGQTHLRLKGA
jgi:hypothetical protein